MPPLVLDAAAFIVSLLPGWYVLFGAIYFLPTLLAFLNRNASVRTVGLINLVFGWTIVGWYISLAAALMEWSWTEPKQSPLSEL